MATAKEVSKMLRSRVLADAKSEIVRARLGKKETDGSWTFAVPGKPAAWCYVTIMSGHDITVSTAICRLPHVGGLEVYVSKDLDGNRVVTGAVESSLIEVTDNTNTAGLVTQHTHAIGSGLEYPIEERRLNEGRVHPTSPASLSVRVEPFDYVYLGMRKYYAGGTLDLTSYRPGTANQHRWVLVGLNPTDSTLTAESGTATASSIPLTRATLASITFDGLIPLAGVKLKNGQTSISAESSFAAARPIAWITGSTSSSAGDVWDVDKTPASPSAYDDEFPGSVLDDGWTEYDSGDQQTVAVDDGDVSLTAPTQDASSGKLTGLYKALPAGDLTLEAKLKLDVSTPPSAGFVVGGLTLYEDAADTSKSAHILGIAYHIGPTNSASPSWITFTDEDAFRDIVTIYLDGTVSADNYLYYRVTRSGSTYTAYWSADGTNWTSYSLAPEFTPAHFGLSVFGGYPGTPSSEPDATLLCDFVRYSSDVRTADDPVYGAPLYATSDDVATTLDSVLTDLNGDVLVDASGNLITE